MDGVTFKQLEALFWSSELGSFQAASGHLNATQSAIAKRIRELEGVLGVRLFSRTSKSILLTQRGAEVLSVATELIQLRRRLGEVATGGLESRPVVRVGVTDLTAMTWLGPWIKSIQLCDSELAIVPQVDLSSRLFDDLAEEKLDIIIVPDAFTDPRFEKLMLSQVPNAWVTSPLYTTETFMPLADIVRQTVITQTGASGAGRIFSEWLGRNDVTLASPMQSSNLGAMVSLAISGFGVSFLPRDCLSDIIASQRLHLIDSDRGVPVVSYVALYRRMHARGRLSTLLKTITSACDYTQPIWHLPSAPRARIP